jgi:hypothetical protein
VTVSFAPFCPKPECFGQQISVKVTGIRFHRDPFSDSQVVICDRRTDMAKQKGAFFATFSCERSKNQRNFAVFQWMECLAIETLI